MVIVVKASLLLIFALAARAATVQDCGDNQHDVENGMIRLPDFSFEMVRNLNCSWIYTAPHGKQLLVKVDSVHLPPLDIRTSQFQLSIDDTFYDIPRNCVQCLGDVAAGRVLRVFFTSSPQSFSNETSIGSFQVRYKAFDPNRCARPEQIENGFVEFSSRKIGQSAFYLCHPPYDLNGDSELRCGLTVENPVPQWSSKTPKCVIQDCSSEAIPKSSELGTIASPGYPSYLYEFTFPCLWEIIAQPNQQIKVSVTYLKFPKQNNFSSSTLSLIDGYSHSGLNLTETINAPVNFTTSSNKLSVQFVVDRNPDIREETGFFLNYSTVSTSCPMPKDPENGEVIAPNTDVGSTIAFRCKKGFLLIGEMHSECLLNGKWSRPTPSCEKLKEDLSPFLFASNNSDTVTATIRYPDVSKQKKGSAKKKASEKSKDFFNTTDRSLTLPDPYLVNKTKVTDPAKHIEEAVEPSDVATDNEGTPASQEPPAHYSIGVEIIFIAAGVGIPVLVIIIMLVIVLVYRRRYPVRMRFGRKFSTFENPMYVSKDAHHPRELTRLTN